MLSDVINGTSKPRSAQSIARLLYCTARGLNETAGADEAKDVLLFRPTTCDMTADPHIRNRESEGKVWSIIDMSGNKLEWNTYGIKHGLRPNITK